MNHMIDTNKLKSQITEEEWKLRLDLAATYRLIALYGWDDLIYTHVSLRIPGPEHHFLINPYGLMFDEITASSLVKIDLNGKVFGNDDHRINYAGYVIHSAVHGARHDVACVMHTHTTYGMVVSALEEGLVPLQQDTYQFYDRVAYHDFEGQALNTDERESLVNDLGDKNAMILKNHGLLTTGRSVAEAWVSMFELEKACKIQILAQSTGQLIHHPPANVMQKASAARNFRHESIEWPWLLRLLDAKDPSYKN